jgi:prepilin-type N-terminal cleavage/methylation domain-containing protein
MSPQPNSKGFTLTEVMVALAFLTIAIFGLVSSKIYAARAQQVTKERQAANVLAISELEAKERILRHDFTTKVALPRGPVPGNPDFEKEVLESNAEGRADLRRVEVILYWEDKNGPQRHSLWTYFYDRSR